VTFQEENNCPPNLSGPDCTIPYVDCKDGTRRCYNNSQCVKNDRKDPVTGEYGYRCDCSFAESVSKVAGHECEHSATEICKTSSGGGMGSSHFCTNGGVCGTFVYRAQVHTGCHCPREYAGAHCQYLKALGDFDFLQGEKRLDEVGVNFYAFSPKPTPQEGNSFISISIGLTVSIVVVVMALAVRKGIVRARNNRKRLDILVPGGHHHTTTHETMDHDVTCANVDSEII
jgi:hypothetical protein